MVTCSRCGQENPEGFAFCGSCGAPLAPAEPARDVRKVVTVVFSDVTGSTALGEQLDPESLRRVMGRYFDEMKTVVETHEGTGFRYCMRTTLCEPCAPLRRCVLA